AEGSPPPGSVRLGCDGKDAARVVRDAVWLDARLGEAGQWWESAPFAFLRVASPYESLPRKCSFRQPDGRSADYSLDWRAVPQDLMRRWFETESKRAPVALSEPRPGIYLITLTTFTPDEKGRAQYDKLFHDIDDNFGRIA